jgi:glutathione S-transferase
MICTWLEGDGVTLADFPKIQNFMTAMEQRESVRAVRAKGML